MKPYYYVIKHKPSGKLYAGSQYGKNSDPSNLLKTYFTSSKVVKQLIEKDGADSFVIEHVDCRPDAREHEQNYLMEMYKKYGREKFLDLYLNRNLSPGIILTQDIIERANVKRKVSNSISSKKLMKEGRHNFQTHRPYQSIESKNKLIERMRGNNYGSFRKMTDELKKTLSEKSKGNTNVRGTKWWTNGIINKRSKECPGDDFILGTKRK